MRFLHDSSIAACDRRISALEHELLELKRHRNALTPICRLPPETLAVILGYLQHGGQVCDARDPWSTYNFEWVRAMLVCRRFRDVALGAAQLWTYVDFSCQRWSPLWIQAFLRNAQCPIVVRDQSGLGEARHFFMKALSVDVLVDAAMSDDFLYRPAPLMQSVRFKSSDNLNRISVGTSFLGGTAMFLHTLCLNNVAIRTDMPDLPSLCLLELVGVYFHPGLTTLRNIIARAPQLRTLCLQDLRPCRPEHKSQKELPRSLPDLQNLYIQGLPICVAQYMHVLPLPSRSLGMILRDEDGRPDWDVEHYTYAYDMWTRYAAERSLDLERAVVLDDYAHLNIGQPVPLAEFDGASTSFFSVLCPAFMPHPMLAEIETVCVRQPLEYDCYDDRGAFGIEAMVDLCVVILEELHPVREDDGEYLRLVESIQQWVMSRRVIDVHFVECSTEWVAVAEELAQMGFSVTFLG